MSEFTKDCLRFCVRVGNDRPETFNIATANNPDANIASLAAFALALMERAENAEKRMKAWGCPDEDFICLNCGRETPCMTEADLKPGDPGVPCTFDLTYPQMIERMHYHEDQQRKAEAERDRLKKELEEATARGPHYLRDSRLRAEGMRAAAEIARNLRPKDACTCGNYLSFRNGVPGHLPGCLVGECIDVADEIEGRAEELDRSNRE